MVEAFNHYRGKARDEDDGVGGWADDKNRKIIRFLLSISFGLDECIFPFPLFVFLLPLSFSLSVVSSMSCSERVRGVWVYRVSPSNNRYRKRNRETAAGREMEVENRGTKGSDGYRERGRVKNSQQADCGKSEWCGEKDVKMFHDVCFFF